MLEYGSLIRDPMMVAACRHPGAGVLAEGLPGLTEWERFWTGPTSHSLLANTQQAAPVFLLTLSFYITSPLALFSPAVREYGTSERAVSVSPSWLQFSCVVSPGMTPRQPGWVRRAHMPLDPGPRGHGSGFYPRVVEAVCR